MLVDRSAKVPPVHFKTVPQKIIHVSIRVPVLPMHDVGTYN